MYQDSPAQADGGADGSGRKMNGDAIVKQARLHMADAVEADKDNRLEELDDLEKLVGKHWPESIRSDREGENKPCLTLNRFPQFVRQVTGDIRRMNPSIKVLPADDKALSETADIYEGLIRQIEYASDASTIYERAAEQAAASSIGWFRVLTQYEGDDSFLQEIRIKGIRNPLSVYCDPTAEMPTREDAGYIFVTEQMTQDEFKRLYPKAKIVDAEHDDATDGLEHWHENDKVVVSEYYWKEPVTKKIVLMRNGTVLDKKDVPEGMDYVRQREVRSHKVMWAKITGHEVLEGPQEQPCRNIPVIAVTGEEWHVADRVHRSSVIRYAKDAQQMYNFFRSAQVEFAALQPKAPYIVTPKQIAGLETFWNQANRANRPYLPYNPDEKAPGAPQRATPPISSQAMFDQAMIAADDMKATTGIYDSALGNQSNEQSGVAIRQRQMESDVSTSIYADNMAKAIGACGRVIVNMIPKIYDTRRIVRTLSDEDKEEMTEINGQAIVDGFAVPVNDLTVGKYDIKVSVGPNYATKRQETAEGMLEFVRSVPGSAQIIGDLLVQAMDWPDAEKVAERLKRAMPPGLTQEDENPQVAALTQQNQQLMQALQEMQQAPEYRKAQAEATEAEADAEKAQVEVLDGQLDLAAKSGELNAAVSQLVEVEVARALQAMLAQGGLGPRPM